MTKHMSGETFTSLAADGDSFLNIDVRTRGEVDSTGLLTEEYSINIPLSELPSAMKKSASDFKSTYG